MATFSRRRNAKDQIMCKIRMNSPSSVKQTRTNVPSLSTHQYAPLGYIISTLKQVRVKSTLVYGRIRLKYIVASNITDVAQQQRNLQI